MARRASVAQRATRRARALSLLEQVEIPDAGRAPRRLSAPAVRRHGQRVMIAMAIACNPRLLIADEPTTALDVTVQAQMLALLLRLQRERGMALMLITHDLGVVAETAQRVVVMYAGQKVETGPVPGVFEAPRHPYTQALLAALPEHNDGQRAAASRFPASCPGSTTGPPAACCRRAARMRPTRCRRDTPPLAGVARRQVRCHFPLDAAGRPDAAAGTGRADAARRWTCAS